MYEGMINRLIGVFEQAFQRLGVYVGPDRLEDLAVLIHKAMTLQARQYHNLEHVFGFIDQENPIQTLAALFHDIVYYQVDLGFLPEIWRIISPYVIEKDGVIYFTSRVQSADRLLWLILEIFGVRDREFVTIGMGANELLSALVMIRKLGSFLRQKDLVKITLCIEATIPFRKNSDAESFPANEDGHFEKMAGRVRMLNNLWALGFLDTEIIEAIQLAVKFANKDVDGFAEQDPGKFLEGTWKLLPEMNIPLRSRDVYSIREYRQAIQSMESSLSALDPSTVFHYFRGAPSNEEFQVMLKRAYRNINTASEYLRIRLLAMAFLESLAVETGGDAPLSLFMGDLPQTYESVQRMEDFLPDVGTPAWIDRSSDIYQLLQVGRTGEAGFDITTAPLSLFVYKSLTQDEMRLALALAREMFAGRLSAQAFLEQTKPEVVRTIARASAAMVLTRSAQLNRYAA